MNLKVKRLLGLFVLSTLLLLIGAIAKERHWESLKPLFLVGLFLETIVVIYAVIFFVLKKK